MVSKVKPTFSAQELEYPDGHTSRSIYVAMPITDLPEGLSAEHQESLQGAALTIWTTTPWTLPANAAVAVNAELTYCVAQTEVAILPLVTLSWSKPSLKGALSGIQIFLFLEGLSVSTCASISSILRSRFSYSSAPPAVSGQEEKLIMKLAAARKCSPGVWVRSQGRHQSFY